VHGTVTTHLEGECSRCLDPVEQDIGVRIDELFMYPEKLTAEEKEDAVLFEDDQVDLGPLVRDTIGVEADERPLCRPDCPRLCSHSRCRIEHDPDHFHDVNDPRCAALQGLLEEDSDDGEQAENSTEQPGSNDYAREKEDH